MIDATKNGKKMRRRVRPFAPGNPGGPGRPQGSRNVASLMLDQLADGETGDILRRVIAKARGGAMRAAEMILSRAWLAQNAYTANVCEAGGMQSSDPQPVTSVALTTPDCDQSLHCPENRRKRPTTVRAGKAHCRKSIACQ